MGREVGTSEIGKKNFTVIVFLAAFADSGHGIGDQDQAVVLLTMDSSKSGILWEVSGAREK